MSEARALTNFAGNSIATVLIGTWVGELDRDKLDARARRRQDPFDEATMLDDDDDIVSDDRARSASGAPGHEPELVGSTR